MKNKFIVLGAGAASSSIYKPFDFLHPSGYFLQSDDKNILIECSEGMRFRLDFLKIDFFSIDEIIISHYHPDHFNLETLMQAIFIKARNLAVHKSINIYGPKNIKQIFKEIWNLKHYPNAYDDGLIKTLDLRFSELENKKKIGLNDRVSVIPYNVFHQYGLMDSYAFRFNIQNKILAYSGDTGICPGLDLVANKADAFVCEINSSIGQDTSNSIGHLNPYQAGLIAKKNFVKKLVLVHYSGKNNVEEIKKEVKKTGYEGKTIVAEDFQDISL